MVELSFYMLSGAVVFMLLFLFKSYSKGQLLLSWLVVIFIWVSYLAVLIRSGVLMNFGFPPRVPLFIVIPAIALIIVGVNSRYAQRFMTTTPLHVPILMQSFRVLVELLIYATYLKGVFPLRATFEGLNFDILVGISAVFVGVGVYRGLIKAQAVVIWNIASLGILLVTVYSFISTYYFMDFAEVGDSAKFVEFPYILLASVLLPAAIFLHAFSLKQTMVRSRNQG
ncbi:MAG: hypothetical protein KI790_14790 [Cyclobacteriaceae bacterium]|nr:hypothetical protein [Cyclobacteriaceae bacterium HetDA_MAG_MS6]